MMTRVPSFQVALNYSESNSLLNNLGFEAGAAAEVSEAGGDLLRTHRLE